MSALIALIFLAACGGGGSGGSGAPTAPTILVQPMAQSVPAGQAARFTVSASGSAPLSYQWQQNTMNIAGATSASYTTPATSASDDGEMFAVVVTNSTGSITSSAARLTVTAPLAGNDVLTYHNDVARTAQNLTETLLTPANVNSTQFGLLRTLPVDGAVDAQPLVVSGLTVGGLKRNVLFVVTEHDSVYTFDADTGAALLQRSLLGAGETTSEPVHGCTQVSPEIGITSTPVIDRAAGANGTLFAVAMSKTSGGSYIQRLHALDLVTLAEQANSPVTVQAMYPGTGDNSVGGNVVFDPMQYKERAALLLVGGIVYTAWASHCDITPYTGWIIGYNESTLAQVKVLNVIPNGSEGSIWQSGGGLAADPQGNLYALVANGTFDASFDANGFPASGDYGNAFIKVTTTNPIHVIDYFAMYNTQSESNSDIDLGSGGPMVLPDQLDAMGATRHLAVGAGKDNHLYVVDRDNLGKFNAAANHVYQDLPNALPGGIWSNPAYFNGHVYYADVGGTLKSFTLSQAKLGTTPSSMSSASFAYPGASPSVSANGSMNGIVWALESAIGSLAVLHAYDANNLATELYNSNQATNNRDQFGTGNKFVTPTIVNGKVYVGTPSAVAVFGPNP